MKQKLKDEPIALIGLVAAVILFLRVFNIVDFSSEQRDAIDGLIIAGFVFCRWLVFSQSTVDGMIDTTKMLTREKVLGDIESLAVKEVVKPRGTTAKAARKRP